MRTENTFAARRRAVARKALAQAKVDALLITDPHDVSYLSSFTGDDSVLLVGCSRKTRSRPRWACLITDGRYAEQAADECRDIFVHVRNNAIPAAVAEALKGRNVRAIGVQADHMTLQRRSALKKSLPARRITALSNVTGALRAVKDAGEIRAIRKAIRTAEGAFASLIARGAKALVGRTERRLAAELDYHMRLGGADEPAFETIVAAGAHSSLPHHRPGNTAIRRGQGVLFDWGARVNGYCSDLTRVVFAGRIPPKLADAYNVVIEAQRAGIRAVRPSVSGAAADAAARSVVERAGYGDRFVHGLGHGIGREIHESPNLGRTAKDRLRCGMVVTVEPGIYLPGVGGIRIEDDILVTADGRRRLSSLPSRIEAMVL